MFLNYYKKYLKYKNKYLELKNQEGGIGDVVASYGIGYMFMTPEQLKMYEKISEAKISEGKTSDAKPQLKDFNKVVPKIKLTNLKTLKGLQYNNFIGTKIKII
jgi:hypothetical protein